MCVFFLDATGLRDADSSLQFKTLGLPTRQATPTATVPHEQKQTRDGVRRSRRLVEKSTRLKKSSSSHSSTQRYVQVCEYALHYNYMYYKTYFRGAGGVLSPPPLRILPHHLRGLYLPSPPPPPSKILNSSLHNYVIIFLLGVRQNISNIIPVNLVDPVMQVIHRHLHTAQQSPLQQSILPRQWRTPLNQAD